MVVKCSAPLLEDKTGKANQMNRPEQVASKAYSSKCPQHGYVTVNAEELTVWTVTGKSFFLGVPTWLPRTSVTVPAGNTSTCRSPT